MKIDTRGFDDLPQTFFEDRMFENIPDEIVGDILGAVERQLNEKKQQYNDKLTIIKNSLSNGLRADYNAWGKEVKELAHIAGKLMQLTVTHGLIGFELIHREIDKVSE